MSPEFEVCEAEALKLSPRERAALAEHLIASLDSLSEKENEQIWLEEAERRYSEYKQGTLPGRSSHEAINDARSALR